MTRHAAQPPAAPDVLQYFAITAAWAGDKELALQQLETGLRAPAAALMLSYGALKLVPFLGPAPRRSALRKNRRFARTETIEQKLSDNFRRFTPALLRLDPMFDPLRNDPRFQKLASEPAAK